MAGWQILVLKFWGARSYKVLWLSILLLKSFPKFKLPRQSFNSQFSSLGSVIPWEQQTQHRMHCMRCFCMLILTAFWKRGSITVCLGRGFFSELPYPLKQCLQASACQVVMFAGGGPAHGQGSSSSSCWRGQAADVPWLWRSTWGFRKTAPHPER